MRELVKANHGRFALASKTGVGTVATIRLPVLKDIAADDPSLRTFRFDHTMHEVELLAAERTTLSRRPKL